ncbi:MAG: type VI secretion system tip protein VgrG [Bacteroidetes Order II. Incertae sedis bacterium]|nr:type VI secretion system tip protein VgrG [Bacteroidetes Order II. bacterium]
MPPRAHETQFTFRTAAISEDHWHVTHFEGEETISDLFEFTIHLLSDDHAIDFADVVMQSCTLTILRNGEEVKHHGIVSEFFQDEFVVEQCVYRVTMVPKIWKLSLSRGNYIYQDKSVREIIEDLLTRRYNLRAGVDFEFESHFGQYPRKEYVVMYQESELDFLKRILEHEGIFFYFDHEGDTDKWVIADDSAFCPFVALDDDIPYHNEGGMQDETGTEIIRDFLTRGRMVTGKYYVDDFNYDTPTTDLLSPGTTTVSQMEGVAVEYGANVPDATVSDQLAQRRAQEIACRQLMFSGRGDCRAFRVGYIFGMRQHFRDDRNTSYLLTHVLHKGDQRHRHTALSSQQGEEYVNEFDSVLFSLPFRPERKTHIPRMDGILTATMEHHQGNYIDDKGRYHARMHFDQRSQQIAPNGDATLPIRMTQPYSGSGYGFHFPHHERTEMVFACLEGDPNRPIALGTVPNANNTTPVTSQNQKQNILRTHAHNELLMDDAETAIRLKTSNNHVLNMTDGGEKVELVTKEENKLVMHDKENYIEMRTTDKHIFHLSDQDKFIQLQSTGENVIRLDDRREGIAVQTKYGHELKMEDPAKKIRLSTKAGHHLTLDDQNNLIVLADQALNNKLVIQSAANKVELRSVSGEIWELSEAGKHTIKTQTLDVQATANADIKSTGGKLTLKGMGSGVEIEGFPTIKLTASGSTIEMGPAGIKLTAMGNTIELGATGIKISAGAIVDISGAMIKQNA